jgi:hypothetical protein
MYINKNHKNYQHTNQILNIIFTKHVFTILYVLKIETSCHKWQSHAQNMIVWTWQPCDIYIQFQILQSRYQHYADQQNYVFIALGVKSDVTAVGEDYSLMWTKVEFCNTQLCTDRLQLNSGAVGLTCLFHLSLQLSLSELQMQGSFI